MSRKLANTFLLFFLTDGGLTILNALTGNSVPVLRGLQGVSSAGALLFGIAVYGLLALSARLPKRIILPPLLFLGWSLLGAMPLPLWGDEETITLWLALAQVTLGVQAITFHWRRGGKLLLPQETVTGPRFHTRHFVAFILIHLLFLPPLLFGYAAGSAVVGIKQLSQGFVCLKWRSLQIQERVYSKGTHRVRLLPMVHIGDDSFYQGISNDLRKMAGVVLLEGVTDREALITQPFTYGKAAESLGMKEQPHLLVDEEGETEEESRLEVRRADVDISEFSPVTVAFLNRIAVLLSADNFIAALPEYLRTPVDSAPLIYDVLTLRNEALLTEVDKALLNNDQVILPWGAAHMPGLAEALIARGFTQTEHRQRSVFRW